MHTCSVVLMFKHFIFVIIQKQHSSDVCEACFLPAKNLFRIKIFIDILRISRIDWCFALT